MVGKNKNDQKVGAKTTSQFLVKDYTSRLWMNANRKAILYLEHSSNSSVWHNGIILSPTFAMSEVRIPIMGKKLLFFLKIKTESSLWRKYKCKTSRLIQRQKNGIFAVGKNKKDPKVGAKTTQQFLIKDYTSRLLMNANRKVII